MTEDEWNKLAAQGDRKLYEHAQAEYLRMRAIMRGALKFIEQDEIERAREILSLNLQE